MPAIESAYGRTVIKALLVLLAGYVVNFLITLYRKRRALNGLVHLLVP